MLLLAECHSRHGRQEALPLIFARAGVCGSIPDMPLKTLSHFFLADVGRACQICAQIAPTRTGPPLTAFETCTKSPTGVELSSAILQSRIECCRLALRIRSICSGLSISEWQKHVKFSTDSGPTVDTLNLVAFLALVTRPLRGRSATRFAPVSPSRCWSPALPLISSGNRRAASPLKKRVARLDERRFVEKNRPFGGVHWQSNSCKSCKTSTCESRCEERNFLSNEFHSS
jgi:hypothetical protein